MAFIFSSSSVYNLLPYTIWTRWSFAMMMTTAAATMMKKQKRYDEASKLMKMEIKNAFLLDYYGSTVSLSTFQFGSVGRTPRAHSPHTEWLIVATTGQPAAKSNGLLFRQFITCAYEKSSNIKQFARSHFAFYCFHPFFPCRKKKKCRAKRKRRK